MYFDVEDLQLIIEDSKLAGRASAIQCNCRMTSLRQSSLRSSNDTEKARRR
jgi:hypothetical protein